ncbi:hypothetical protein OAN21_00245 [Alphaproteobacteria bacterium]|nr:hypothetical protein [Alphaproteobacteria bacterium]
MIFKKVLIALSSFFVLINSHSNTLTTLNEKTGGLSSPMKELLEILDISLNLSTSDTLKVLQGRYGRKPDEERHQIKLDQDLESKKKSLWPLFKKLDMVDAVMPSKQNFDAIVILGATIERMQDRLIFLLKMIQDGKIKLNHKTRLFIAAGDRELFSYEDISKSSFPFRAGWVSPAEAKKPKTEGEAAAFIVDQMIPDKGLRNRFKVLIAPKRYDKDQKKWVRPHTGNTIEILLKDFKKSTSATFLFISNNPYISYQDAVITREFLDQSLGKKQVTTIGEKTSPKTTVSNILDNVRNTLQRELEVWDHLKNQKVV